MYTILAPGACPCEGRTEHGAGEFCTDYGVRVGSADPDVAWREGAGALHENTRASNEHQVLRMHTAVEHR